MREISDWFGKSVSPHTDLHLRARERGRRERGGRESGGKESGGRERGGRERGGRERERER